jgi:dTDP-4-amino-4,6-dideoxygalactose transaminase
MQVPLLDLRAQYAPLKAAIESSIREVCDTQQFVLGPQVSALESAVAEYSQTRFAIGVSSGTDALLLALMALGIGPGDEVVTTPYTFFATAGTIARVGARPVFCDIATDSFNLDPERVATFLATHCRRVGSELVDMQTNGRVKAIMPVHLFGQMADMDAFAQIAGAHGLRLIEDAAQAIGAELADGRRAGSLSDVGCFSFFPTKNLGAFGDAGMCVTNDADLAERMRIMRVHGGEPKYYHSVIGGNFRLDALQAAILRVKLPHLDDWTRARQSNAVHYAQLIEEADLDGCVAVPTVGPGMRHIFNQYVIRAQRRDELRAYLAERGIGTEIYYPVSLHEQRCFAYLDHTPEDFPNSSGASATTLALPVYPELAEAQRTYVVESIMSFYESDTVRPGAQ